MIRSKKVLIAGYGSAGQYVTDFILKDHRITHISELHLLSRKSEDEVRPRIDLSVVSSGISGRYIPIKYHQCDFNNIDNLSEILYEMKPDIIVYTGRYASGLKYGSFSYPNKIGYGVWMPMSFPYIYKLMQAVKQSKLKNTKVINTSFPDGVNYLLGNLGLAPFSGAGNINHLIPRIKKAANTIWGVPVNEVDVTLACSHYVNTYVSKEGVDPHNNSLLRITKKGTGITYYKDEGISDKVNEVKTKIYRECMDKSIGGQVRNQMIATDCAEIVRILVEEVEGATIHIPGVKGSPGGRKYIYNNGEFTPDFVDNIYWTPKIIDKVNIDGLYNDGVIILEDGIQFTDRERSRMKEVFGLEYPKKLIVDDIQDFADEISAKLKEISK